MALTRRAILAAAAASLGPTRPASAQGGAHSGIGAEDRVFICNEDSNTLSVIDPRTNTAEGAVNLTSFDEDPRPPFRS
jgi:YVTN family beta-propeller protein